MRLWRGSGLMGLALLSLLWGTSSARADNNTSCGYAEYLVPDGSTHEDNSGGPYRWYRFRTSPDRSYSIVTENISSGGYLRVTLSTPISGSCDGTPLTVTDTSQAEPETLTVDRNGTRSGSERFSFKSSLPTDVYFNVQAVLSFNSGDWSRFFRVRVEETTLFNPMFHTYYGFEAVYRLVNTTNQDVSVTLKLINDAGSTVAAATFTVGANGSATRSTGASDLNVPDNTIGQGIITHDGPPGAILADGFMSSTLTGALLPIKITSARQQR